jgi:hypothetical protein
MTAGGGGGPPATMTTGQWLTYYATKTVGVDADSDVWRPLGIVLIGLLFWNLPTVIYKTRLLLQAVLYMTCCFDKSFKKPADPGSIFGPHLSRGFPVDRKRVYLVRHGESTWNDTFNKGAHRSLSVFIIGFIPGLIKAAFFEVYLLFSGKQFDR